MNTLKTTASNPSGIQATLNAMAKDCEPIWRQLKLEFRFTIKDDSIFQLEERASGFVYWLPSNFCIVFTEGEPKPYIVEVAHIVPGVYRTRNGDGWPDDVDIIELKSFISLQESFLFLFGEWFKETIDGHLVSAAEDRLSPDVAVPTLSGENKKE